jgi:hypothetical protein
MNLVMTDEAILGLVQRPELIKAFPYFGLTVTRKACCNQPTTVVPNFEAIRANTAHLSKEKQIIFRQVLGVDTVKLWYRSGGKLVEVNF